MNDQNIRIRILKNSIKSKKEKKLLEPSWLSGWTCEIGFVNLSKIKTESEKVKIFFASAQFGVIFEYDTSNNSRNMQVLTGHDNFLSSFDIDSNGRLLVTADKGDGSKLIVWDYICETPIRYLISPFKTGTSIVRFCDDSKYLITVSEADVDGEQSIDLWNWKSESEKPTCSTRLGNSFDPIVHFAYSYDNPNFYCFTTKKRVFFVTLIEKANEFKISVPIQDSKQIKYRFTQSVYIKNFRQVVSASTGGMVTVWDDIDYTMIKVQNTPVTNDKKYLKTVKLDNHSITTIICHNENIITGNRNGDIYFYDLSLRILYHLKNFIGHPINSIEILNNKFSMAKNKTSGINVEEMQPDLASKACDSEKLQITSAFTTGKRFECNPFIISTKDRNIFLVDKAEDYNVPMVEHYEDKPITALETHPICSRFIIGTSNGRLSGYDYQLKFCFASNVIGPNSNNGNQITCIKYSPKAKYLCCGTIDGSFWLLDSIHLVPLENSPYKWNVNSSKVQHITFSKHQNYVVYTDSLMGIYVYGLKPSEELKLIYYGCFEVHTGIIKGIAVTESKTGCLTVYSAGTDHRIVVFDFDKTWDEPFKFVKSIKIETWHEPQCMMRLTTKKGLNMLISGKDLRLTVWNENRCIRTTRGVKLDTPIKIMKESHSEKSIIYFCNDTDIGILRKPVDGNPYKNVVVNGCGKKLIDIGVSFNNKHVFSVAENSTSVVMWSINMRYFNESERNGGKGLSVYSPLLEGGENGSEIKLLKEYFYCVQIANNESPETRVLRESVDICDVPYIMRAMGYYPSENEISNMKYEIQKRRRAKNSGQHSKEITFEELVALYLNYKQRLKLKFGEVRRAFDSMVINDEFVHAYGDKDILTRESFVHAMKNMGEKICNRELEIIFHTLLKTFDNMSSSGSNNELVHFVLPFTFTFKEMMTNFFGFKDEE